ncbi:MAG: hypothetical protein M1561_05855, partial [Gammaproteobacteria bacterium]|nr:hypothetical protein [Gammaproteobacteria bacterium]
DDYVVSLMKAIGGNIPVLSMFTNTIAGAHGFISSRGKLEQINKIVRFLPTTTDGDQFVETLARRLTFAQERELKAIPAAQVGLIKRAIRAGKNFKCWLTADDNNNPVRQLANQHCEACLAQVIGEQFTIPAILSDIPRMVIAILGKRPISQTPLALEMPRDASQSSACSLSSFFVRAASSSQTEVSPAPSDNQALITSLLAEQERIRKTIADNEKLAKEASEKAEQAEKASREAKADTSKIKKAITGLGLTVAGDNSAQVYASASANPDSVTSFEDLAKENAELRDRLQELETRMGIALERMEQHGSNISGLESRVYRRH